MTRRVSTSRLSSSTDPGRTGPPQQSIKVGYIRRAHGVNGAVVIRPLRTDPGLFAVGRILGTDDPEMTRATLLSVRSHNEGLLVVVEGVANRTKAEALRGTSLYVPRSELNAIDPDEFWPNELMGLAVFDSAGRRLGRVVDVVAGESQDRLTVSGEAGSFEVPFVTELVIEVDVGQGQIVVDLPEGLVDL
ncbi:MAG: ribosome maturation factor RimM [Acidimicrobiia bacterium]|nr:ribosome maturation factor RimM [Acidimicrobiia bacterium]